MRVLGIDPSLTNLGYVILDGTVDSFSLVDKGKLQTTPDDGLDNQRYIKQANGVAALIQKYNIKYVATEAPFLMSFNTEVLYALQCFLHVTYWAHHTRVVIFPPTQLKSYACPDMKVHDVLKQDMVKAARKDLNMRENERLANDVADAFWVSKLGLRYWLYFTKSLPEQLLTDKERQIFTEVKTYSKGKKKGIVEKKGIVYRKNELYYLYDELELPDYLFLKGAKDG